MLTPYVKKKYYYFEFEGKIVFNDASQNLIGVDEDPRYRIEPTKLKQILNYSFSPVSLNYGYVRDETLGMYLKNCDLTKNEAESEFFIMTCRPPYSYYNNNSYSEYVSQIFDENYQAALKQQYDDIQAEEKDGVDYRGNAVKYKLKTFNYYYSRYQPTLRGIADNVQLGQFTTITD
tara:strand:+ start:18 stop:545 length:528 start_codon:yes stop_codon:yes gene_type:complete